MHKTVLATVYNPSAFFKSLKASLHCSSKYGSTYVLPKKRPPLRPRKVKKNVNKLITKNIFNPLLLLLDNAMDKDTTKKMNMEAPKAMRVEDMDLFTLMT